YPLVGSQDPAITPALRAALANGLRDDLDRKANVASQADMTSLVLLMEDKLATDERDSLQRLLAGSRLHDKHRHTLFGMLRKRGKGKGANRALRALQRLAIGRGLKDDRARCAGLGKAGGDGPSGNPGGPGTATDAPAGKEDPVTGDDAPATSTANENTPDTPDPKTTDDAAKAPPESAGPSTTNFT